MAFSVSGYALVSLSKKKALCRVFLGTSKTHHACLAVRFGTGTKQAAAIIKGAELSTFLARLGKNVPG